MTDGQDVHGRFHQAWLGMVQPIDGLVLSVPVLAEAQCMERLEPAVQTRFKELCPEVPGDHRRIADLTTFLHELLDLGPEMFDAGDALPEELSLYVPEGKQTLRPTRALRHVESRPAAEATADTTPASRAGAAYIALLQELPDGLDPDVPETTTGPWHYPASAKFDRLLRHCRVPIGLLTNGLIVRLVYAPHGESSGAITFRIDDMAEVGGRPILDAFVMLLSARRWFGVVEEHRLPALLRESRRRQADVTNTLAEQVFDALAILLRGFEAAAERDGRTSLDNALHRSNDHLYGGLLTVLLRLVFVLYCEDRGLLPIDHAYYRDHLSLLTLHDRLRDDQGAHPDSMGERFGAYSQLLALFRSVFLGARHGDLDLPARKGDLFDPNRFPFLEGWGPGGSAPIVLAETRAQVKAPSVDDGTVLQVLDRLLFLDGQRLSYRALDVEQIGSVYEALMGYHVVRLESPAVCLRPNRTWITAQACAEQRPAALAGWLQDETGLAKAQATKLAAAYAAAGGDVEKQLAALETCRAKGTERAATGRLVLQPGAERRRTSSHYTPRSLSEPIVRRTLEPLLLAMGNEPSSQSLLDLKVCDPAMGSGAFLVEACRLLADQVVAAWTREGQLDKVASVHEDVVNHARRLVAQRCLYGVDKNQFAVQLAKLSLWLLTMARELPFTFVDHALRHGDSLLGLSFEQIRGFHWKPKKDQRFTQAALKEALDESIGQRQKILDLAADGSAAAQREKELLLDEAEHALERVRLIGDLVVGAFFSAEKPKEREAERQRRERLVFDWLERDDAVPEELRALRDELRASVPAFHWMIEFPEVFHVGRADPLREGSEKPAMLDAFVGNPPFLGGKRISTEHGDAYANWLEALHGAGKSADISAHFFLRAEALLGDHGTIGLIATNTIAQGDTRQAALQPMLQRGFIIYDATRSMPWPGHAAVSVAVVHLAKGEPAAASSVVRVLDGQATESINSRLRPRPDRPDPVALAANRNYSFVGCFTYGTGFVVTPEERDQLIRNRPLNEERICPYLGGDEVNSSPTQSHDRYVINFGTMTQEESSRWPELMRILRERVEPERSRKSKEVAAWPWWQFWRPRTELYEAVAPLSRCLVTGIISKHLMLSFQPTDRVFSHKLNVFVLDRPCHFAILQSRVHVPWAWLLSSTMKTDLNYSASDCFETFPFPSPDPRTVHPALEQIGQLLYDARAAYMVRHNQGLTDTYNQLKDATCTDAEIEHLRALHVEMDRAVLATYGWSDIAVPPFVTPTTPEEQRVWQAFEDEVIDRLFALNAARAEEERLLGVGAEPGAKGKRKAKASGAKAGRGKRAAEDAAKPGASLFDPPASKQSKEPIPES